MNIWTRIAGCFMVNQALKFLFNLNFTLKLSGAKVSLMSGHDHRGISRCDLLAFVELPSWEFQPDNVVNGIYLPSLILWKTCLYPRPGCVNYVICSQLWTMLVEHIATIRMVAAYRVCSACSSWERNTLHFWFSIVRFRTCAHRKMLTWKKCLTGKWS